MKNRTVLGAFAALAALAWATGAFAQAAPTAGEVTKLDKATGRVTLKHGEIKSLEMPAMTMVYRVRDTKLLDAVAVGDRVSFTAERVDGQYTVTALNKQP